MDRLTAAELDEYAAGQSERASDSALLLAWAVHQVVGSQATDEGWHHKFGRFSDFLAFFKPPFVILPEDENESA